MWTLIGVEAAKLKRSLALLLCIAAPSLVALLSLLMFLRWGRPEPWDRFTMGGAALWAYFMLPMTVTALTVLLAQIEHGPRAWNHLLALPVRRWQVYLAKGLVVVGLVGAMNAGLTLLLPAAGLVAQRLPGAEPLTGPIHLAATASLLGRMFAGSLLLVAVQLWTALRFRSFVPPLVLGICGTFVAVAATSAREGVYFPWLIPVNVLATDPSRATMAIGFGFTAGLVALGLMAAHLSRIDVR